MPQHYTKNTVQADYYCGKCAKVTPHRIDDGRLGPCLTCIARYEKAIAERKPVAPLPVQGRLF